ncbi:pentapeptide repeat-containing protein [Prochlorococcus sp. MIT 1342]|uniref:pentapeptide repeat-containing protein n=1 Tax=Prochlorococcus sp. MIT 1342 TaxID=3082532 RepID=UPI0039B55045
MAPNILKNTGTASLESTTDLAATLMDQIQQLITDSWVIDYPIDGGSAGEITGTTNDFGYKWDDSYKASGTIIPGVGEYTITPAVPAYTITPAVPAYTITPAIPGTPGFNACPPFSCPVPGTPGVPAVMSPAIPAVMSPAIPAVMTPAIPAVTGSVSGGIEVDATVTGVSDAINPLLASVTFKDGTMTDPDSSGLATETVTYNFDQVLQGDLINISGSASFTDLSVDIAGVTTNLGTISLGTMDMQAIPDIPLYFDAVIDIPSFNDAPSRTANGVAYELFPQATKLEAEDISLSTGVNVLCDFITDSLLDPLTSMWDEYVGSLFEAVGASVPEAPSQYAEDYINQYSSEILPNVNTQIETNFNADVDVLLPTIIPYVQAITAATWDYEDYPILPNGNHKAAILTSGLFSGVDASNSDFTNANCQSVDFSYANLTGCDFTGANLAGANLTGATGAPSSLKTNTYLEPALGSATSSKAQRFDSKPNFDGAVLHGANLKGTDFDLTGAYYDVNTMFDEDFDIENSGLKKFHPHLFIVTNDLYEHYGNNANKVIYDFANDNSPCGCKGKPGLRTKLNNGEYRLSKFNGNKYYKKLSNRQKTAVDTYLSENTDEDRDNYLASLKVDDLMKGLRLNADKGGDKIVGGYGNDRIYGDSGDDKLYGNTGDDYLSGGKGDDRLTGNDGNDILKGRLGDDTLTGGDGADIFMAGKGKDVVKDFDLASGDIIQIDKDWEYEFISKGDNTIIYFGDYGSMKLRDVDLSLFEGNNQIVPRIELI